VRHPCAAEQVWESLDSYLEDLEQEYFKIALGSQRVDNFLDGLVGFVVSSFQSAVGAVGGVG
jgi:hypothetical protein